MFSAYCNERGRVQNRQLVLEAADDKFTYDLASNSFFAFSSMSLMSSGACAPSEERLTVGKERRNAVNSQGSCLFFFLTDFRNAFATFEKPSTRLFI